MWLCHRTKNWGRKPKNQVLIEKGFFRNRFWGIAEIKKLRLLPQIKLRLSMLNQHRPCSCVRATTCLCLIPNDFVAASALTLPLPLRLSHRRITRFNLKNRRLPNRIPKKIPLLHHKIAVSADFCAIMPLHSLIKRKTISGNIAFHTPVRLREPF